MLGIPWGTHSYGIVSVETRVFCPAPPTGLLGDMPCSRRRGLREYSSFGIGVGLMRRASPQSEFHHDPSDRNQTEGARGPSELMDPHDRHRGKLNSCTPPSFHHGLHVSKSDSTGPRSDSRSPKISGPRRLAGSGAMPIDRSGRSSDSELYTWPALGHWLLGPAQSTRHSVGPSGPVSSRKTVLRKSVHPWAAAALAFSLQAGASGR